jgi:hypothetical protein
MSLKKMKEDGKFKKGKILKCLKEEILVLTLVNVLIFRLFFLIIRLDGIKTDIGISLEIFSKILLFRIDFLIIKI